jgi:hypothetical protein
MTRALNVRIWDENWTAIEQLQKAHADWLRAAQEEDSDLARDLAGLEPWTAADVVNNALKEYCEKQAANYRQGVKDLRSPKRKAK